MALKKAVRSPSPSSCAEMPKRELGSVLDHELEQVYEQREIRHPGIILAVSGRACQPKVRREKARRIGCWRARIGFSRATTDWLGYTSDVPNSGLDASVPAPSGFA